MLPSLANPLFVVVKRRMAGRLCLLQVLRMYPGALPLEERGMFTAALAKTPTT
jgi:hypothetical protein